MVAAVFLVGDTPAASMGVDNVGGGGRRSGSGTSRGYSAALAASSQLYYILTKEKILASSLRLRLLF